MQLLATTLIAAFCHFSPAPICAEILAAPAAEMPAKAKGDLGVCPKSGHLIDNEGRHFCPKSGVELDAKTGKPVENGKMLKVDAKTTHLFDEAGNEYCPASGKCLKKAAK